MADSGLSRSYVQPSNEQVCFKPFSAIMNLGFKAKVTEKLHDGIYMMRSSELIASLNLVTILQLHTAGSHDRPETLERSRSGAIVIEQITIKA